MLNEKQFADKFADIVVKYMSRKNIKNEVLAQRSKVATETISRLRSKHKKRITAYLLIKVSKALNIPLKEIWNIL